MKKIISREKFINKIYKLNDLDSIVSDYIKNLARSRIPGTGIPITKKDQDPLKLKKYYEIFSALSRKFSLNNKKILEIGCGFGGLIYLSHIHQIQAYGIEPDQNMVDVGQRILKSLKLDERNIKQGFGENLPYPSNSFDYIFSFQVLEHVADSKKVIKESLRVLRPNGTLFFILPNYNSFYEGHINKLWFPFINKNNYKYYLWLYGIKEEKLKYVNFISPKFLRHVLISEKVKIVELGSNEFKKNYFHVKNLNKIKNNLVRLFLKLIILSPLNKIFLYFILKNEWYYPIVMHLKKLPE